MTNSKANEYGLIDAFQVPEQLQNKTVQKQQEKYVEYFYWWPAIFLNFKPTKN